MATRFQDCTGNNMLTIASPISVGIKSVDGSVVRAPRIKNNFVHVRRRFKLAGPVDATKKCWSKTSAYFCKFFFEACNALTSSAASRTCCLRSGMGSKAVMCSRQLLCRMCIRSTNLSLCCFCFRMQKERAERVLFCTDSPLFCDRE